MCGFSNLCCLYCSAEGSGRRWTKEQVPSEKELAPFSCFSLTEGVHWGWTSTGSLLCSAAFFSLGMVGLLEEGCGSLCFLWNWSVAAGKAPLSLHKWLLCVLVSDIAAEPSSPVHGLEHCFCQVRYTDFTIPTLNSLGRFPKAWRFPGHVWMRRRVSDKSWSLYSCIWWTKSAPSIVSFIFQSLFSFCLPCTTYTESFVFYSPRTCAMHYSIEAP